MFHVTSRRGSWANLDYLGRRGEQHPISDSCSALTAALCWRLFSSRVYIGCTTNSVLLCSSINTDLSTAHFPYSRTCRVLSYGDALFVFLSLLRYRACNTLFSVIHIQRHFRPDNAPLLRLLRIPDTYHCSDQQESFHQQEASTCLQARGPILLLRLIWAQLSQVSYNTASPQNSELLH